MAKEMHVVREDQWIQHCNTLAGVVVRLSDAKPEQKTMRLTIDEVIALVYDQQMRTAYFSTRPDKKTMNVTIPELLYV